MTLKNKTALITGGAQGLGLAMVKCFCLAGGKVYFADIEEDLGLTVEASLQEQGCDAKFIKLDIRSEQDWLDAVTLIDKAGDSLDILVNNAGINIRKPIEEMSSQELDMMLSVNVRGPFLGIKAVLPHFKERRSGCIINMSSVCGLIGHKFTPEAYTTTKGAVTLLTKSIAARYGEYNIRCNSIHPSTVDTALVQQMLKDPERRKERLDEVPLGRMASLEDVANAALYLVSDKGSFLNGVALPVDGGVTTY